MVIAAIIECMRYGLVPIITQDTDIAFNNSFLFEDFKVEDIKNGLQIANSIKIDEYITLARKSYSSSLDNFPFNYSNSLEKAFCETISNQNR